MKLVQRYRNERNISGCSCENEIILPNFRECLKTSSLLPNSPRRIGKEYSFETLSLVEFQKTAWSYFRFIKYHNSSETPADSLICCNFYLLQIFQIRVNILRLTLLCKRIKFYQPQLKFLHKIYHFWNFRRFNYQISFSKSFKH